MVFIKDKCLVLEKIWRDETSHDQFFSHKQMNIGDSDSYRNYVTIKKQLYSNEQIKHSR